MSGEVRVRQFSGSQLDGKTTKTHRHDQLKRMLVDPHGGLVFLHHGGDGSLLTRSNLQTEDTEHTQQKTCTQQKRKIYIKITHRHDRKMYMLLILELLTVSVWRLVS